MIPQKNYGELSKPLNPRSLKGIYWGIVSSLMRLASPISSSLMIGYRYGFDSGEMLDYVYENKANGRLGIGKLIDRIHLNAVGWKGIRQRKVHLKAYLKGAILDLAKDHRELHIVDVAAGPGRYLLEILSELRSKNLRATLRDWDEAGLTQGRELAKQMGLTNIVYDKGDAFSPTDLTRISPNSHIVVVSGLYELFSDNALITASLQGIYSILEKGGRLIYTNQPTHPQLELIARCLPNREGKPWVMRLRSQAEMDGLVKAAGFRFERTVADRWGIFTVSMASKVK